MIWTSIVGGTYAQAPSDDPRSFGEFWSVDAVPAPEPLHVGFSSGHKGAWNAFDKRFKYGMARDLRRRCGKARLIIHLFTRGQPKPVFSVWCTSYDMGWVGILLIHPQVSRYEARHHWICIASACLSSLELLRYDRACANHETT
jgi:hypothetical protein